MKSCIALSGLLLILALFVVPAQTPAHEGGHGPHVLGPPGHDKPGPPPIHTTVQLESIIYPYKMWKQDAGSYAEPVVAMLIQHEGHYTTHASVSNPLLTWNPHLGSSDWGEWVVNKVVYLHRECSPMEPITITIKGMEADASQFDALERKILNTIRDIAKWLDDLLEFLGLDFLLGIRDLIDIGILVVWVVNPDDDLGSATAFITDPDRPEVVRTSGGQYDLVLSFTVTAPAVAGGECDADSIPVSVTPPAQCTAAPAFFDSLRDAWVEAQSIAPDEGNPADLNSQDIADAVATMQSLSRQMADWLALGLVSASWGYQGASTALSYYQSAAQTSGSAAFALYQSAFCAAEVALRGGVLDPAAGPMPTLVTAAPKMISTRTGRTATYLVGAFGSNTAGIGIQSVSGGPPGAQYELRQIDPSKPWYALAITQYGPPGTYPIQVQFTGGGPPPMNLTLDVDAPPAAASTNARVNHDIETVGDQDAEGLGQGLTPEQLQATTWINDWPFDCNISSWTHTGPGGGGTGAAHLYSHATDNDVCSENITCAWLFTDPLSPTLFCNAALAFGPGGQVVTPGLDEFLTSPLISLASTPAAKGTSIDYSMFPGNSFPGARIVSNWSVRSKVAGMFTSWQNIDDFGSLGHWGWLSRNIDISHIIDPDATDIQVRFRVADWGPAGLGVATTAGSDCGPGPGPYMDSVRIGRRVLTGPVISEGIDSRSQAQDCFPAAVNAIPVEHYSPTTDRFGTCPLSAGEDLATGGADLNVVDLDVVHVRVVDARTVGGITSVDWHGAIVKGPHAGKAPAPYSVGPNGFFVVSATKLGDEYTVDLDDTYFRGGDVLLYLWTAVDAGGGFASNPAGLTAAPISVHAAEFATAGLFEVSFLPAINWSSPYLARIAADTHGDLDPTPAEIAGSVQKNCLLYVQMVNSRRRSGDANRTSFMYTLDMLGYRDAYDVFDVQGFGDTNNQLGSRATVQQATGYSLIIQDSGRRRTAQIPDGQDLDSEKIDQATWYRNWLANAGTSAAGYVTLWLIGENLAESNATKPLLATDMGVSLAHANQGINVSPDVAGQTTFTFDRGASSANVSFTTGNRSLFSLNGGCADSDYDGLGAVGSAVRVYRFRQPGSSFLGDGAIVMKSSAAGNWNTILASFPWSDSSDRRNQSPGTPQAEAELLSAILGGVLPANCLHSPSPTDVSEEPAAAALPQKSVLHPSVPNPFNPTTTIHFDLAESGRVRLRIYDAAGRWVRTLIDADMSPGWNHQVLWNGLDGSGRRVAVGVYFCKLETTAGWQSQKLVVMK